jgi:hypothetical protein
MPDLEDRGETDLEESFEKGEPHKDVQMTTLIEKLKPRLRRELEEQLRVKESMKIQLGVRLQLYQLRPDGKGYHYKQANLTIISGTRTMTKASLSDVADELLNDLSQDVEGTLIESSQWKIRRIPMAFIKVYKIEGCKGLVLHPDPAALQQRQMRLNQYPKRRPRMLQVVYEIPPNRSRRSTTTA